VPDRRILDLDGIGLRARSGQGPCDGPVEGDGSGPAARQRTRAPGGDPVGGGEREEVPAVWGGTPWVLGWRLVPRWVSRLELRASLYSPRQLVFRPKSSPGKG